MISSLRETASRWLGTFTGMVGSYFSPGTRLDSRVLSEDSVYSTLDPGHLESELLPQRFVLASRIAGAVSAGASLAVLAGWIFDIPALKSVVSRAQSMKVNTALGLMVLGVALWVEPSTYLRTWARRTARTLAVVAILIGVGTALEYGIGRSLHIDELFLRDAQARVAVNPPGRMAPSTAISIVLLGCAFLLTRSRRGVPMRQILTAMVGTLSFVRLVGYLYGLEHYRGFSFYLEVALPTSVILFLLSLGAFFASPTRGWMETVTSQNLGGVMARRLLPVAVVLPLALGWLRWQGQMRGYFDHAFGMAMSTTVGVGSLFLLIWAQSRALNRLDQERAESYRSLKESEAAFRELANSMPQLVWTARADGWLDYCNQQWTDYTGMTASQTQGWGSIAVIHRDDVASVMETWNRAIESGIADDIEFRLKRASDGAYRWHLGRGVAMRDASGKIVRWFGTSTDIHDYKRTQQELEEAHQQLEIRVLERTADLERSNTLLNAILDSMADGVICVNEKYEHVLFNRAARELLGSAPPQASPDQRAEIFGIYHPDKKTLFRRDELPLGRALRGESCDSLEMFGRIPGQRGGRWLSASSRPVRESSGRLHGAVLVLRDITRRKEAEETQVRLLAILEETTDFIGTAKPDGTIFYANRALRGLRGIPAGVSLEGIRIEGTYPEGVIQQKLKDILEIATVYGSWRGENVFRYSTGEEIAVSQIIMSHRNPKGEVEFMSTIARDISETKENEATLQMVQAELEASLAKERELSRSDALTGLPNRRAFFEAAETEKERSRRYSHAFGLAYLDLDGFKKVNDTLGHAAGDKVLIAVAEVMRNNLRASDTVARLGGDEFAVLLPETDPTSARKVMTKLQALLRSKMKDAGWNVDFSIGLASFLDPPESVDYIIRTADELMYSVKTNGKGALVAAIMG